MIATEDSMQALRSIATYIPAVLIAGFVIWDLSMGPGTVSWGPVISLDGFHPITRIGIVLLSMLAIHLAVRGVLGGFFWVVRKRPFKG